MVDSLVVKPKGANCEDDLENFVITLGETHNTDLFNTTPVATSFNNYFVEARCNWSDMNTETELNSLDNTEINIIAYITGYITRKIREKICKSCLTVAITTDVNQPHLEFINTKAYNNTKDGLIHPTKQLNQVMCNMERSYRSAIDRFIQEKDVKASLVVLLEPQVEDLACNVCNMHKLITVYFVSVRYNFTLKLANQELSNSKFKQNRRMLKFTHM